MGLFSHLDATPTDLSTAVLLVAAAQGLKRRMHMARVLQHIRAQPTPYGAVGCGCVGALVWLCSLEQYACSVPPWGARPLRPAVIGRKHRGRRGWRQGFRRGGRQGPTQDGPYRPPSPVSPSRHLEPPGNEHGSDSDQSSSSSESSSSDSGGGSTRRRQCNGQRNGRRTQMDLAQGPVVDPEKGLALAEPHSALEDLPTAASTLPAAAAASPFAAPSVGGDHAAADETDAAAYRNDPSEDVAREVLASLHDSPLAGGQVPCTQAHYRHVLHLTQR